MELDDTYFWSCSCSCCSCSYVLASCSWPFLLLFLFVLQDILRVPEETAEDALRLVRENGPWVYELFAVLIHSGSALGGHYYAHIKSLGDGGKERGRALFSCALLYDGARARHACLGKGEPPMHRMHTALLVLPTSVPTG